MRISGNIVDVVARDIYPGTVFFGETVTAVEPGGGPYDTYLVPGYIDAHIHIESTMLMPAAFSWCVAPHGTAAVVADPHEIANVCGMDGIALMMKDAQRAYADIYFAAPSCVPASPFETSGATLGPDEIRSLLSLDRVVALGEMMNYPGVIAGDPDCRAKLAAAREAGNPVDGHCPGLSGQALAATYRRGRARSTSAPPSMKHGKRLPRDYASLSGKAQAPGISPPSSDWRMRSPSARTTATWGTSWQGGTWTTSCRSRLQRKRPCRRAEDGKWNPARHYGLSAGEIAPGRPAHLLVLGTLTAFTHAMPITGGAWWQRVGCLCPAATSPRPWRVMHARNVTSADLAVPPGWRHHAIGAVDGSLVTAHLGGMFRDGKNWWWRTVTVGFRYRHVMLTALAWRSARLHRPSPTTPTISWPRAHLIPSSSRP